MRLLQPDARTRAFYMLVSGAFMISFSAVFVKLAHVAPAVSAFYRVSIGGIVLVLITRFRHDSFHSNSKTFIMVLVAGLFFAMDLIFFHHSILIIGPGLSTILGNFQVFFMATFAIFILKEKPTAKFLLSIPLAVAGLFLIVGLKWEDMSSLYKIGIFFGLMAGLCYTFYILCLRNTQMNAERLSIFASLALISLISSVILLGYILSVTHDSFVIPDLQTFWAVIGLGLVSQVFGWILITKALPEIEVSLTGLILLLQPALSYVWDILFFNHPVSFTEVTGAVIALSAIYLGSTGRKKAKYNDLQTDSRVKEEII